jgi:hypothetical protein
MVASITFTVQGEARGAVGPSRGCADPRIWLWSESERSVGREYPLGGARCPSPTPTYSAPRTYGFVATAYKSLI